MLVANEMNDAPLIGDERKSSWGYFHVAGLGRYAIFEDMPIQQHLEIGGKKYLVMLRQKRRPLPFEVKLIKFEKQMYPGTDKPRRFQSEVILQDGKLQWHSLISMNSPLRYKGYTFYQSSFIDAGSGGNEKPATVLAVSRISAQFFLTSQALPSASACFDIHLCDGIPGLGGRKL